MDERSPGLRQKLTPPDHRITVLRLYPGVLVNGITNYLMQSLLESVPSVTHEAESARQSVTVRDLSGITTLRSHRHRHDPATL